MIQRSKSFLLALSLTTATQAWAYIPPSAFILKNLVSKHSGLAGIQVTSFVNGYEGAKPSAQRFKATTFFNASSGIIIGYAIDASTGQKLYQIEKTAAAMSAPATIMLGTNLRTVEKALKSQGVEFAEPDAGAPNGIPNSTSGQSLVRFKSQVAWVIGEGKEKLWVEKDSFLPIRLVGTKGNEIRFENYRFYKEFPYPRLITVMSGPETIVLQDEASEILVYSDAAKLKAPKFSGSSGLTSEGSSAPSELKELIQQYYEALR